MHDQVDILQIDRNIQSTFKVETSAPIEINKPFVQDTDVTLSDSFKKKLDLLNSTKQQETDIKNQYDFYLLDTIELIEEYKNTLQTPIKISFMDSNKTVTNKEKDNLVLKYIENIKKYNIVSYPYTKTDTSNFNSITFQDQSCSYCSSYNLTESVEFVGVIICLDCGGQETTMNLANSIRLTHNDSKRVNICTKYSYDKKSHFLNCINQYQGKHKTGIEPEIIKLIEAELDKYNLIDHSKKTRSGMYKNVTKEHVFLFVKELRLTKCYGDINLIHHLITGTELHDISHLTEKLLQDFDQFVQMHHKLFPNDTERKNFNYQHLLYQLLLRHKYTCNPSEFNFLKTVDRKYYHDEICRIIFENLGWNYSALF